MCGHFQKKKRMRCSSLLMRTLMKETAFPFPSVLYRSAFAVCMHVRYPTFYFPHLGFRRWNNQTIGMNSYRRKLKRDVAFSVSMNGNVSFRHLNCLLSLLFLYEHVGMWFVRFLWSLQKCKTLQTDVSNNNVSHCMS